MDTEITLKEECKVILADLMKREYTSSGESVRVKTYKDVEMQTEEYSECLNYKIAGGRVVTLSSNEKERLLKRGGLNVTFVVEANAENPGTMTSRYLTEEEKIGLGLDIYTPQEVDRDLYMKSICEVLNYDCETITKIYPSTADKNEAYFWTTYQNNYLEYYNALYPLYENVFKSQIEMILRDNYIVIPDEVDEESGELIPGEEFDLDRTRFGLINELSGYYDTAEYLKNNPHVDRFDLAKDLTVYILYYTNAIDVFGKVFLDYLPGIEMGYRRFPQVHPTFLPYTLNIDEETVKIIMANLNSPQVYILNLGDYNLLSNKDSVLVKLEEYISKMENTIKNEVKILESNHLSESIIEGFINDVLVKNSKLLDSNKKFDSGNVLPLKLAFTTLKGTDEIAKEYFEGVKKLMVNKEYALTVGKITMARYVILKTLLEWYENYTVKIRRSKSIQITLNSLDKIEAQLAEKGMQIEYYMLTPSKMKVTVYNTQGRGEEGVQAMEDANSILFREFGNNLDLGVETSTSNRYNVDNNLMRSFVLGVYV